MFNREELEREFNEAFGEQFEEEEEYISTEPSDTAIFNAETDERTEDTMNECLEHFLHMKTKNISDEGRYLYKMKDVKTFVKNFLKLGGNLKELRCGIVRGDSQEVYAYELFREKYYDYRSEWCVSRRGDKIDLKKIADEVG